MKQKGNNILSGDDLCCWWRAQQYSVCPFCEGTGVSGHHQGSPIACIPCLGSGSEEVRLKIKKTKEEEQEKADREKDNAERELRNQERFELKRKEIELRELQKQEEIQLKRQEVIAQQIKTIDKYQSVECEKCKGTGIRGHYNGFPILCSACNGRGKNLVITLDEKPISDKKHVRYRKRHGKVETYMKESLK